MSSMKLIFPILLLQSFAFLTLHAQNKVNDDRKRKDIHALIDKYSQAREQRDTVLLKSILTSDVDQLVSTGEWRNGIQSSVKGMLSSSASNPGGRTLTVDKVRFLNPNNAIVDCKYEIRNPDGSVRKMWSTFVVAAEKGTWKISAIRNMLPAGR
jgi:uncharacterized protein (TIGR02246 family)